MSHWLRMLISTIWPQLKVRLSQPNGFKPLSGPHQTRYCTSGIRRGGFDVADGGNQTVFAGRYGVLLQDLIAWQASGNSDTYKSVVRAINICDEKDYGGFDYDVDGIGASVRGDALNINTDRCHVGLRWIYDEPFRGSGAVFEPEAEMVKERKNKDFFLNLKAQELVGVENQIQQHLASYEWFA